MEIQLTQTFTYPNGNTVPRTIPLAELHQIYVYEGLLEGLPTKEMNLRHLERAPVQVQQNFPYIPVEPYLVPPGETPIEYRREGSYPFGEPSRLPAIQCIGRWRSHEFGK